jgi:hypothetical protein
MIKKCNKVRAQAVSLCKCKKIQEHTGTIQYINNKLCGPKLSAFVFARKQKSILILNDLSAFVSPRK